MQPKKRQKPSKSTSKPKKKKPQGSLDALLSVIETVRPDISINIETIRQRLTDDDKIAINKIFDQKLYPDQKIYYGQVRNYDNCKARIGLNSYETAILSLMIRCMSQHGYVSLSLPVICDELSIGSPKTVRKAISALLERDLIRLYKPSTQHAAAVYYVNPQAANSGKNNPNALDYKKQRYEKLKAPSVITFAAPKRKSAYIKITEVDSDGVDNYITYGTLVDAAQVLKKSEATETVADGPKVPQLPEEQQKDHSEIPQIQIPNDLNV
jgi:hypothetical protein